MGDTREGSRDYSPQTRSSQRPQDPKSRRVVSHVDAFPKTLPNTVAGLRELLRWFMQQVRDNYSPSIRGGSGKLTRWDHHGAQVEASIREVGGKLLMELPISAPEGEDLVFSIPVLFTDADGRVRDADCDFEIFKEAGVLRLCVEAGEVQQASLDVKNSLPSHWRFQVSAVGELVIRDHASGSNPFRIEQDAPTNTFRILSDGKVQLNSLASLTLNVVTEAERDAITSPVRGMILYVSDGVDEARYEAYWEIGGAGTGVWLPLKEFPSFAFGALTVVNNTVIGAINTPVQVVGQMVASGGEINFTLDTTGGFSAWTYIGPNRVLPITLSFDGSGEKAGSGVPETFRFRMRVNNVDVGLPSEFSGRQNEPGTFSCTALSNLQKDDVVTFFVENRDGTSNCLINLQSFYADGL